MLQEYFYHSFSRLLPNESEADNYDRSFKTLESILRNGILFAPEEIKLPFELQTPLKPIVQHRVCFTLIERSELIDHASIFGKFSLEFDTGFLRKVGITPTMYLPIFNYEDDEHLQNVSSKFVFRLITFHQEIREKFDEVSNEISEAYCKGDLKKVSSLGQKKENLLEKRAWLEGLSNMIYPIDNKNHTKENGYYRQREWKLPANLTFNGKDITTYATSSQQKQLLGLNYKFFSKKINYVDMQIPRCAISFFWKEVDEKHILEMARKLIVPQQCVEQVKALLADYNVHLAVEEL